MSTQQHIYKPGQSLFNDGDAAHTLFLIKRGTVSIRKGRPNSYVEVSKVFANEVVGELSFFERSPRSAAAVAITEVEAIEIDFTALDKVYEQVPDYFKTIMASVAERLKRADDTIRRLQKQLGSEEEEEAKPEVEEPEDIAAILAATTEPELPKPDGDSGN
ncbi:MAG: Crp/Fnr family transcriptional regulator [Methylotenera sp.]|nr:Crp/Fnr family transcriptional regulator [Oligoflexia bacterium]